MSDTNDNTRPFHTYSGSSVSNFRVGPKISPGTFVCRISMGNQCKEKELKVEYSNGEFRTGKDFTSLGTAPKGSHAVKIWSDGILINPPEVNINPRYETTYHSFSHHPDFFGLATEATPTIFVESYALNDWCELDLPEKVIAILLGIGLVVLTAGIGFGAISIVNWMSS